MIGIAIPYQQYEPSLLEPVFPDRTRKLEGLAIELAAKTDNLTRGLHPVVVRSMNSYYSNLIEEHRTTPRDIERALQKEFLADLEQRDLQLKAKAHIEVQTLVDLDFDHGRIGPVL